MASTTCVVTISLTGEAESIRFCIGNDDSQK